MPARIHLGTGDNGALKTGAGMRTLQLRARLPAIARHSTFHSIAMITLAIQHFNRHEIDRSSEAAIPIINATRAWVEKAVIGLNLCPFAKAVQVKSQIRYAVSNAMNADELLADLVDELRSIAAADEIAPDTTLLIHPNALTDFIEYNAFLDVADHAIAALGLEGEIQVASFHPDYQFADAAADDISNYTNRSPYPILHLLRETSIEHAMAAFPDASAIFEKNIETLRQLGLEGWQRLGVSRANPE